MQLNYKSTESDQSYFGRIFLFARRNMWLFLLDIIIIVFLALPPYSMQETFMLIVLVIILLFRDAYILIKGIKHLGKFVAKGNHVEIGILKGSSIKKELKEWLPDIDLEIKYSLGFPIMFVYKENSILFKQYSFGDWTGEKMKEFIDSFYEYKKEQNLWKIYKGQE